MFSILRCSSITGACFLLHTGYGYAQKTLDKWQVGANGGISIYQGDLTLHPAGEYRYPRPATGLFVSRVLNRYLSLRTNFATGNLAGDESAYTRPAWRNHRNFRFTTKYLELSELLVWNIPGNSSNELGQRFSPYAFAGAGFSVLRVHHDVSGFDEHYFDGYTNVQQGLTADLTQTPPRMTVVLPAGVGVEYILSPKFSLTAETTFRYTFSDRVDGFSLSANPNSNDFYHTHTLGFLYRFGGSDQLSCPVLRP